LTAPPAHRSVPSRPAERRVSNGQNQARAEARPEYEDRFPPTEDFDRPASRGIGPALNPCLRSRIVLLDAWVYVDVNPLTADERVFNPLTADERVFFDSNRLTADEVVYMSSNWRVAHKRVFIDDNPLTAQKRVYVTSNKLEAAATSVRDCLLSNRANTKRRAILPR
jgi:hypothetical protein